MFSNGVGRTESTGPLDPKQVGPVKRTDSHESEKSEQTKAGLSKTDQANISVTAAEVARYREMAELHREAYGPEDRSAKLNEVKERIASGFYDDAEVVDSLAGRLADESISTPAGSADLETVRSRSERGFYDRPEVIDKTAENVVKSVLPGLNEE